jgi:taurine--2-oxoglutarate transaminase
LLELVKNRETREPLVPFNPKPGELGPMPAFNAFLREHGLFTFVRWNTCFINPPLCINEQQLREGLEIIDQALEITDAAL